MHRERECRLCLCKSFVSPAKNNISFERAVSFLEIGTHFILCVRPRSFKTTSFLFERKTKTNERVQWDHWRMWPVSSFSPPFLIFIYLFIRRGTTTSGYARGIFRDPHPTARHLKFFFFFSLLCVEAPDLCCVLFSHLIEKASLEATQKIGDDRRSRDPLHLKIQRSSWPRPFFFLFFFQISIY